MFLTCCEWREVTGSRGNWVFFSLRVNFPFLGLVTTTTPTRTNALVTNEERMRDETHGIRIQNMM
jgi:hypothetical protein